MSFVETFGVIGSGEFGRVVAEHLSPEGAEVLVFDTDKEAELPQNACRVSFDALASADVIVIAVPYDSYPSVIPELAESTPEDTLIVDVCSVKMGPTDTFGKNGLLVRNNVLMTHPLFGPQTASTGVAGKNLVVTQEHGDRAHDLLQTWQDKGINTVNMSAEDHDREMAKVQALPFMIGRTLLNMGIEESPLGTNYFSKLLALVDVERHHSPELFDTIQRHNPFAASVRSELIASLCVINAQIEAEASNLESATSAQEQITRYRAMLDVIDDSWPVLLGLRFGITKKIGRLKAEKDIPSRDTSREQAQREEMKKRAIRDGVPTQLVLGIQRFITDEVVSQHDQLKGVDSNNTNGAVESTDDIDALPDAPPQIWGPIPRSHLWNNNAPRTRRVIVKPE